MPATKSKAKAASKTDTNAKKVKNTSASAKAEDEAATNATTEQDDNIVPTKCFRWSLNVDTDAEGERFWWYEPSSMSIWESCLELEVGGKKATTEAQIANTTDDDVWRAYFRYQIGAVYKVCNVCKRPEQNVDCRVCFKCGSTVHVECSAPASEGQISRMRSEAVTKGLEQHLALCNVCETEDRQMRKREYTQTPDNARRACLRALASAKEYPKDILRKLYALRDELNEVYGEDGSNSDAVSKEKDAAYMDTLKDLMVEYFQPADTKTFITKKPIETKCGGQGVVAVKDIPRFTIIGVYPGYEDRLNGEQMKIGRPDPKYSLGNLNCADYHNNVFPEHAKLTCPFVNEPNIGELSNIAWIQENFRPEGRMSMMTVRDIKAGEELLIGYGPLYPRTYPYTYDAYAYHLNDDHDANCFALWHWTSLDEKDANFVCYCGYDPATKKYSYWETEDEAKK